MQAGERVVLVLSDEQNPHLAEVLRELTCTGWAPRLAADPAAARSMLLADTACCLGIALLNDQAVPVDALLALCAPATTSWIFLMNSAALEQPGVRRLIADAAYDYHTYPVDGARLSVVLGRAWGMAQLRTRDQVHDHPASEYEMVGTSPAMLELFATTRKIAAVDAPVLITGESGTGKELTALAIHERSQRRAGPFVAVNCNALPPSLLQAELFGYEKGAFTGATARQIGRIESASGGTLLLDEIGDLPIDFQGHLLRFLQEGTIERLGSSRALTVNVRIIAATNVDLERAVREGRFREDLYYRLNVLRVEMPPLRARGSDVTLLAQFFFRKFAAEKQPAVKGYSRQALDAIQNHDWPGNVRELINRVRRAMVMSENRLLTPADLGLAAPTAKTGDWQCLEDARTSAERATLSTHIRNARGNLSLAARQLGVSRVTLYRLMKKHNLPVGDERKSRKRVS